MKHALLILALVGLIASLTSCNQVGGRDEEILIPSTEDTVITTDTSVARETTLYPETTAATQPVPPESDDVFVKVRDFVPDIVIDLKYATTDNFTGQVIYESGEAWLRYGTVKKLALVQEELRVEGLGLKLWDGFRPPSAQFKLWEICPDPTYVANPNNGFSSHSRGNTVDITVVELTGEELKMPTGFDDFSLLANRDYSDCDSEAASNALMLEQLMKKHGFKGYYGEWWHFTDTDSYEVEHNFVP